MSRQFGERLRKARIAQRLTQSQLGAGKYSPSYVSLLETGAREPTEEVITELSLRLGLERDIVEFWNTPVSPGEADFALLEHRARASFRAHDYEDALATALEATTQASEMKKSSAWWNMAFVQAEALRELGRYEQFLAIAEDILAHPLTDESVALQVRAETLVASANQAAGRLQDAVAHAQRAARLSSDALPHTSLFSIEARFALIATLAEAGRLDEAWAACGPLIDAVRDDVPAQTAGSAHWAIGNVAFRRQDIQEGIHHHDLAAKFMPPAADIALWTRFNKASANARLVAGVVEPATLACIERAEAAQAVIGELGTEGLELRIIRARWLQINGEDTQALEVLSSVQDRSAELPTHIQGEAELLAGRAHLALGDGEEAMKRLSSARECFAAAGALDRAALAVELATMARFAKH